MDGLDARSQGEAHLDVYLFPPLKKEAVVSWVLQAVGTMYVAQYYDHDKNDEKMTTMYLVCFTYGCKTDLKW